MTGDNEQRLYIPDKPNSFYSIDRSLRAGEGDLMEIAEGSRCEYEWIYYPDPDRWVFFPQTHKEIEEDDHFSMQTAIHPKIVAVLHEEGVPISYHIHPKRCEEHSVNMSVKHYGLLPGEARNLAQVYNSFPTRGDIGCINSRYIGSEGRQPRSFCIATRIGLMKISILACDDDFLDKYEDDRNLDVLGRRNGEILEASDLERLTLELIEDHNALFSRNIRLSFYPRSYYGKRI